MFSTHFKEWILKITCKVSEAEEAGEAGENVSRSKRHERMRVSADESKCENIKWRSLKARRRRPPVGKAIAYNVDRERVFPTGRFRLKPAFHKVPRRVFALLNVNF